MARISAATPLEPVPSTNMPSTNNVDRCKRSNSELSVDGLALLASTVIAEWDSNGQHDHRRKMLELSEMCIASREDQWLEKYNQLKELYQKHGRAPVTYSNCTDKSLVAWVKTQRQSCKVESRIKLLKSIGFVFSASDGPEDQWLEKYNELREFYQKHGHTQVTLSNYSDKSLTRWVQTQRRCCKMEKRRKMLDLIEFIWSPKFKEDQWLEKFNQLNFFYNAHGHTGVKRSNADNSLAEWVYNQRKCCKTEKRRKMLKSIGFVFSVSEGQEDQWLETYNHLRLFYKKHGHTQVTFSNCSDKSLVDWVKTQRRFCKIEKRKKMLDSIEFIWSSQRSTSNLWEDQWLEKFNQLKEFYNAHGHTRVRRSNADNSLAEWVCRQRRCCNTENRRKMLESIEFV